MDYPEVDDFDNDLDYLDAMRKFNIWNRDHGHLSDAEIEELRECQKNERAYLKHCLKVVDEGGDYYWRKWHGMA